jgi:hypothetical protein
LKKIAYGFSDFFGIGNTPPNPDWLSLPELTAQPLPRNQYPKSFVSASGLINKTHTNSVAIPPAQLRALSATPRRFSSVMRIAGLRAIRAHFHHRSPC